MLLSFFQVIPTSDPVVLSSPTYMYMGLETPVVANVTIMRSAVAALLQSN
jgi:hypothetical protein